MPLLRRRLWCYWPAREDDGKISIAGDPDHPANFGKLCSKGMALGETLGLEQRLLATQYRRADVHVG